MSMSIKDAGRLGLALGGLMVGAVIVAVLVVLGLAILSGPARAQGFTFGPGASGFGAAPRAPSAAAAAAPNFFNDLTTLSLTTNLKLVLDAGASASYTSGQSWLDLAGSGYDFFRGLDVNASTDDPTFNGSAGALTSSEYFSFDGGDYFTYDTTNETWMQNIHKDSAKFTILVWLYAGNRTAAGFLGTAEAAANVGFWFGYKAVNGTMGFDVVAGGASALSKTTAADIVVGAWNLVGISIDEAAGAAGGFFYLSGGYSQVGAADTWDPAYTAPSAAGATYTLNLGSAGNAARPLFDTNRFAGVMVWQGTALTKAQIDTIWNVQKTRFGL